MPLPYDPSDKLFKLPFAYIEGSGLNYIKEGEPTLLYFRREFHELFQYLREDVIQEGKLGWIVGPSGVGKSMAAFAFALNLNYGIDLEAPNNGF